MLEHPLTRQCIALRLQIARLHRWPGGYIIKTFRSVLSAGRLQQQLYRRYLAGIPGEIAADLR